MTTVTAKLSRLLLILGAGVGIAAFIVLALDLRINIPDWIIQVAMIKLGLVASLGLLGAGAVLGRHAKRQQASLRDSEVEALGAGMPDLDISQKDRSPESLIREGDE